MSSLTPNPDPILKYEDNPSYAALVVYGPMGDNGRVKALLRAIQPEPELGWRCSMTEGWRLKSGAVVKAAFIGDMDDCRRLKGTEWHCIRVMDEMPSDVLDFLRARCRSSDGIEARFIPYAGRP